MQKYLVGLIFLISSYASAMETKIENLQFFYLNSGPYFSVFYLDEDTRILDDDGLPSIVWMVEDIKLDNSAGDHLEKFTIILKSLERLKKCLTRSSDKKKIQIADLVNLIQEGPANWVSYRENLLEEYRNKLLELDTMKAEIHNLVKLINEQPMQALPQLEKFIAYYGDMFVYLVHDYKIRKLVEKKFRDLKFTRTKDMPPISIIYEKAVDSEVNGKDFSEVISKEVIIDKPFDIEVYKEMVTEFNKPSLTQETVDKVFQDKDRLIYTFVKVAGAGKLTEGSLQYYTVLNAIRLVQKAFLIFDRLGPKKKIGQVAVLSESGFKKLSPDFDKNAFPKLSEDDIKKLRLEELQKNLAQFLNKYSYCNLPFIFPDAEEINPKEPLYLVWHIEWAEQCASRQWIFKVEPMESSDDARIMARVTLSDRFGSEPDREILGNLYYSLDILIKEIKTW